MELKSPTAQAVAEMAERFNRTLVELKFSRSRHAICATTSFNRTLVELKLGDGRLLSEGQ